MTEFDERHLHGGLASSGPRGPLCPGSGGESFPYESHRRCHQGAAVPDGHSQRQPGEPTNSSSPYAAPFLSFTHDGVRFAVFPQAFLDGHSATPIKAVPVGSPVRSYAGRTWHTANTGTYRAKRIEVSLCRGGVSLFEPDCAWVDVTAHGAAPDGFDDWIASHRGPSR